MTSYHMRTELHIRKDIGLYVAFGICAYNQNRLIFHIADIFLRRRQAIAFVALCNREQPDWRHMYDIIEDVI